MSIAEIAEECYASCNKDNAEEYVACIFDCVMDKGLSRDDAEEAIKYLITKEIEKLKAICK